MCIGGACDTLQQICGGVRKKKELIGKLKLLCSVRTEKAFEEKLADLEKDMNERAKEWLKGEMVDKDKWALAYDEGGGGTVS